MKFQNMKDALSYVYTSFLNAKPHQKEVNDAIIRSPHLTQELLTSLNLILLKEKVILVTGSKGKGSTSRMIAAILRQKGYKVGLYTSPHLVNYNERIRVNGKAISDSAFLNHLNDQIPVIEKILSSITDPKQYLGPTGILLSIALAHFIKEETDINVFEIGRGGTFDDTNVLENKYAILSKVMEEHLGYLGNSIEDIVQHKAGIVKESTEYVIVGSQTERVRKILKGKIDRDAFLSGEDFSPQVICSNLKGSTFSLQTKLGTYEEITLPLLGSFQVDNAAVAIQACEMVVGEPISENIINACFRELRWPGRLEVVEKDPTVVLDGSINRVSATYLKEVLPLVDTKNVATIIAVPENKDYEGVIKVCSEFSDILVVTKPDQSHKTFPADALAVARRYHARAMEVGLLSEAVPFVRSLEPTLIFIVGTQSMIGNAKEIWKDSLMDIG